MKVFYSPMSFFDTTPSGRIINIFSHDMDEGKASQINILKRYALLLDVSVTDIFNTKGNSFVLTQILKVM